MANMATKKGQQMTIISLFDESGNALRPWARGGHICYALDILNEGKAAEWFDSGGAIIYILADVRDPLVANLIEDCSPDLILGWPPCTDVAVSGAAHFAKKRERDPDFQQKALALALFVKEMGERCDCSWMFENPISVLSTLFRKPDHIFHPYEYGGYLPESEWVHPRWPEYIADRDAYPKRTCIWAGNGFKMPEKRPVPVQPGYSAQHKKLGGKSSKTKQIRSETARGFAQAIYEANVCSPPNLHRNPKESEVS